MIEGAQLRDAFISAAHHIENQKQAVDALNVFPVPDGDTGTNMSMTITAAARELSTLDDNTTAVSYTHLDVYKRQGGALAQNGAAARGRADKLRPIPRADGQKTDEQPDSAAAQPAGAVTLFFKRA